MFTLDITRFRSYKIYVCLREPEVYEILAGNTAISWAVLLIKYDGQLLIISPDFQWN